MRHRHLAHLIFLALLAFGLSACSKARLYQQESYVFGTRVEIQIAGADETQARSATAAVLGEFDRLHRTYHAWRPSELSELNAAIAVGKPQAVTAEMAALISNAQELASAGDALFDPGIGGLIRL